MTWEVTEIEPFDELILSWNAERTETESYSFFLSFRQNGEWSPWLYYAEWGAYGRQLCDDRFSCPFAKAFRGTAEPAQGKFDGFRVEAVSPIAGSTFGLRSVIASISRGQKSIALPQSLPTEKILFDSAPRCSLLHLRLSTVHEFSPAASASVAVNYLIGGVDTQDFIQHVYDQDYDCYEHWPLIAAEMSVRLGAKYSVHVERLDDFGALYSQLQKGCPVLVGLIGTLPGGPRPFQREHGVCVIGYDPAEKKVHCIDPGFMTLKASYVAYPLADFVKAWGKRKNIACIISD
jgi:hypothetical protein